MAFYILPADPEAKLNPRLATGPGSYEISKAAQLTIVIRGQVMYPRAQLEFSERNEPYEIKLPTQSGVWAIAWKRDTDFLWIADRGKLRKVDFSNPADIQQQVYFKSEEADIPARYLNALQATLDAGREPPAATAK